MGELVPINGPAMIRVDRFENASAIISVGTQRNQIPNESVLSDHSVIFRRIMYRLAHDFIEQNFAQGVFDSHCRTWVIHRRRPVNKRSYVLAERDHATPVVVKLPP